MQKKRENEHRKEISKSIMIGKVGNAYAFRHPTSTSDDNVCVKQ